MDTIVVSYLLYPYPYQQKAMLFTIIILLIIGAVGYFIYTLINFLMNSRVKAVFNRILIYTGILLVVLFFAEATVSLITIHHVNKQLGFTYATPDTPEGELFEIQKVVTGELMDKAGLKRFDRVQMNSVNKLYLLLINNQGKEVVIPVVRDKQKIEVRVLVPELHVPLAKVSFLF